MLSFRRALSFGFMWVVLLGLVACKKDAPATEDSTETLLVGRWELTHTSGGLAGNTQPANPNLKQEVVFTRAGSAQFLQNGTVASTARYALSTAEAITGQDKTFLAFIPSNGQDDLFISSISSSELVLSQNYNDGFSYHYTRR